MRPSTVVCRAVAFFCLTVLAGAAPSASQQEVEKRLAGTWSGVSGSWGKENPPAELISFTFRTNHQCEAKMGDLAITGTYQIDISTEPFQIDFSFEHKKDRIKTLTIFTFTDDGLLRIAEWDPNWRRKDFNPVITFRKMTPSSK